MFYKKELKANLKRTKQKYNIADIIQSRIYFY